MAGLVAACGAEQHVRGLCVSGQYNGRWQKARATYLRRNPLCVICKRAGRITAAKVVDHITPHKNDQALFWDTAGNWQALCKTCHDRKTATEDGGFGRAPVVKGCDVSGMPTDPRHPWHECNA
jgi:5-methylcytosine-specific restriction endonuclease McrA